MLGGGYSPNRVVPTSLAGVADIAPITGQITGNAQTIPVNVANFSNLVLHCFGTFSTVNCTFEATNEL